MPSHDSQLLKGVLSLLLLRLLDRQEDYGYSVVVRLHQLGFDDLTEGTVYPALTRLEKRGLLASRLVRSSSGPARKYYRLTPTGEQELADATKVWTDLVTTVEAALGPDDGPEPAPTPPLPETR
ncbi:MAG: PadR family transcriptional regulator [Actinomycetota bacterium]